MDRDVATFVERCFRDKWREIILTLTRRFGTQRLDEIENAAQTALLRALDSWSTKGVPDNPAAWIIAVAQNAVLDSLRREQLLSRKQEHVKQAYYEEQRPEPVWTEPLEDDVLKMMMVCAHPSMSQRETLVITLRIICGLGIAEISKGLLSTEAATKKLLTRTKSKIRDQRIPLELPPEREQEKRLDRILQCIYLLCNEGYSAYVGDNLIRRELFSEAERLCDLLLTSKLGDKGAVWALAALLAFQASRLAARVDDEGGLILLAHQDRTRWNGKKIAYGFACLEQSMASEHRSRYHLEAAIAGCHAAAPSYEATDWRQIREFYDELMLLMPSPVVELNRSVAVLMTDGPKPAIAILQAVDEAGELRGMYLLPALLGDFHRRAGQISAARSYYQRALDLVQTTPVRQFLIGQIETCLLD